MGAATPLRVALIGPPLDASGGIGRAMSYLLDVISADDIAVTVLDTRGHNQRPVFSVVSLGVTCARIIAMRVRGDIDICHINISAHGSSVRKPVVVWLCRLLRIPVILHLHASSYREFFAPLPESAKAILRATFKAAAIVVVLGDVWRDFVATVLGVPGDRILVLPNAVPDPGELRSRERGSESALRILFLGRLGPRKGVPELIGALASPRLRRADWTASFAGDGDIERYKEQARSAGIGDRVRFLGWVDTQAISALLRDSDVLLLPSHAEGLPLAIIESLAHGVPVIATPVGAIGEAIIDGENGLIVTPGDPTELSVAIERLLVDEPLRARLAANARRTWQDRYAISGYAVEVTKTWRCHARRGCEAST